SWSEKDLLQDGVTFDLRILQKPGQAGFLQVHDVVASSRSCSDVDHSSKDRRTIQRHLLCDHATQRKSENVAGVQAQAVEESTGVLCHTRHCFRHLARS